MWAVIKIIVPFWGTLNIRGRIIIGIQEGAIILTTTHVGLQTRKVAKWVGTSAEEHRFRV